MKRRAAMILVAVAVLALACHKKGGPAAPSVVDPELVAYEQALAPARALEADALAAVAAKEGAGFKDDQTLFGALHDVAIPKYREFAAGLDKIQPKDAEIAAFHERLKAASRQELGLLERLADAVARGDGLAITAINGEQRTVSTAMDTLSTDYGAMAARRKKGIHVPAPAAPAVPPAAPTAPAAPAAPAAQPVAPKSPATPTKTP